MDTLPRIKGIEALPNYRLSVVFDDGKEVVYDVGEDIEQVDEFRMLKQIPHHHRNRECKYQPKRIPRSKILIFIHPKIFSS